jgi:hypothetical protein
MILNTLLTFHPKVKKIWNSLAGLLAFHIADAFPFLLIASREQWLADGQQQIVNYSCGDSSGIAPVFPINLLLKASAEEPRIRDKHSDQMTNNQ